jgi:hypothetical protein
MEEELRRVLSAHSLPCGAVIAAPGAVVTRAGDYAGFANDGLVPALLGPDGSPAETLARVADQLEPQLVEWQDEFAIVDRLDPDGAVVVFGRGRGGSTMELLRLSQEVGRTIREAFGLGRREWGLRNCERCGRPIPPERREQVPRAVRCWDCQVGVERSG